MRTWLLLCSVAAEMFTLGVVENMPLSSCEGGFKGIEVDIVRDALALMSWKYDEHFRFRCLNSQDHFDAEFGGVTLTEYSYTRGVSFSVPTLAGGLSILVSQDVQDTFTTYLGVLNYTLWLGILGACIFVTFFVWLFERGNPSVPSSFLPGLKEASWISVMGLMLMNTSHIKRMSTRVLLLSYWLFCFMILALFVACNARNYLIGMSPIHSPESLKGRRVISCEACIDSLMRYGPLILDFRIDEDNFDAGVALLRGGEADAIVFDYDFMQGYSSAVCDLTIVSPQFSMYYYVVQISDSPLLKAALDTGLSQLRESTNLKLLEEQYLLAEGVCNQYTYDLRSMSFLRMMEVWMVWTIVMICAFVLRAVLRRTEMLQSQSLQQDEVRALMSRPETRILKHTEMFVHNMTQHVASIFNRMEKAVKKHNFLQQQFISTLQNLTSKLDAGYKVE